MSYKKFAKRRMAKSACVRTGGRNETKGCLKDWENHDPREFDEGGEDVRLPFVYHTISNFKAHVQGVYHGVTQDRLQSYAMSSVGRNDHETVKAKFGVLLGDLFSKAKRPRAKLQLLLVPQVALLETAA